jgi:hypothetical protein
MANPQHVEVVRQGAESWNRWRKDNPNIVPDLSRASITKADIGDATLYRADLSGSDLSFADLSGNCLVAADFYESNLTGAKLAGSDLAGAHLSKAKLVDADLSKARLIGANLNMTRLYGADLTACTVGWTLFAFVDLRAVKGLEEVIHEGPNNWSRHRLSFSRHNSEGVFAWGGRPR